jgi:hypothetical protein
LTEKTVFVAVDGKVLRRPVRVGTRTESRVQVLEGLKPGDQVIVSNIQQMRAGLAVLVSEAGPGGAPKDGKEKSAAPKAAAAAASEGKQVAVETPKNSPTPVTP